MFAQLPFEIVENIVEYLDFKDVGSIARVCSAFRLPAQLRLFRTIRIASNAYNTYPKSILSSLHLLQYPSHLLVSCIGSMQQTSIHSLCSHFPTMYRLRNLEISLAPNDCSRALSALERLGSVKKIALNLGLSLAPDLLMSDNPLPVHSLRLHVVASTHQVATRLVQKCSQSLRKLSIFLKDKTTPRLPFLPHLCEFSLQISLLLVDKDPDLKSWFPFFYQHPTITHISLDPSFTLAVQPSPYLLPNLQSLEAPPAIIERLIPGRPVNRITAEYFFQTTNRFPGDILLRPLRQPVVSVTNFAIKTNVDFSNDILINIVQTLPKLRKFSCDWHCYEIYGALQGILTALGKCEDMVHIRLSPSSTHIPANRYKPLWSRGDFVQMVQRVQENGAADLWRLELRVAMSGGQEGCDAVRIGWLDVPRQPKLRGEWRVCVRGSSSNSDVPRSAQWRLK